MLSFLRLVCCSILVAFAGCGSHNTRPQNTVEVWHWMTDRHETFETLAARYKEQTGVTVKFELFAPSDAYTQKVTAAAQSDVLPEIYGILDKKSIMAAFIEEGLVADLTAEFQANDGAWEISLFPKALNVNRFEENNIYKIKPGIYGVPIDVMNIQMVYNKKLLQKAGITNPPSTWDEFLKAAAALKRIGVPAFVSGWGELWMLDCFASDYAFNIMGEEKVFETIRGNVPYTDPDWIKVLSIFKELKEKNVLVEGIVTKGNKYAEQDFALERAAFAFNGSWCVNVYNDMNPDLEYGVMLPPAISSAYSMRIWGGAGGSFVVNDSSSNKQLAVDFLKWLTAKEQQAFLAEQTKNIPANRESMDVISPILAEFAKAMDHTTHPTIWPVNEDPLVSEAFTKGIQSILIGERTPEQVAKDVQAVKDRQTKRTQK